MLFNDFIGFKYDCRVKATLENIICYPFHTHNNILEAICVIDGSYRISNGALEHDLSYGDVYFFNAPDTHKIERTSETGILLTIHIDLSYFKETFSDYDGTGQYDITKTTYFICDSFYRGNIYSESIRHLRFLMAKIYMIYSDPSASSHDLEDIANEFLTHILDYYQNYIYIKQDNGKYAIVQNKTNTGKGLQDDRFYRITEYLIDNSTKKITLKEIADREYLSPNYLSSCFKKGKGLSISELLSVIRCEHAETLLGMTSKNLDEIASKTGLSNRSHLTNQFKKWFGKTPSQYRKELNEDLFSENTRFESFDYDFAMRIINSYLDGY
ncbi:MAG: AraC family transcriptional regulator [Clostridia bacterium]|nr:AraC family transcriptional regulator [Clostridia bacterium]